MAKHSETYVMEYGFDEHGDFEINTFTKRMSSKAIESLIGTWHMAILARYGELTIRRSFTIMNGEHCIAYFAKTTGPEIQATLYLRMSADMALRVCP